MYDVNSELKSVTRTRRVVNLMLWVISGGAILYSLMTGAPLVSAHSEWKWTGWVLPVLVDAALVLSLSADAVLSKHGMSGGKWPTAFRWITGLASLFLNAWSSLSAGDWVGVGIHSIAPVILICASEVAPIYRRKFRALELSLTEQVTEEKVTRVVQKNRAPIKVQSSSSSQVISQPAGGSDIQTSTGSLTENQLAIRDGFLNNRKAAEVAREIGLSSSYVSREFRKIKAELDLTA